MTFSFVKGCLDEHVCIYSLTEARELQFFIELAITMGYLVYVSAHPRCFVL